MVTKPLTVLPLLVLLSCGGGGETPVGPVPPVPEDTLFVTVEGGPFVTSWGDSIDIGTFQISRFEVTNRLYYWLAMRSGTSLPPDPGFPGVEDYLFGCPDCPVVNVSAVEAGEAAASIGCRLPTAAEWEYAASLGLTGNVFRQYPWGSLRPVDAGFPANFMAGDEWDSRGLDGFTATAPVGSYPLTGPGLADMAGNVAEWTLPVLSVCRVEGGSWASPSEDLTIGAFRDMHPSDRSWLTGFRLAR